MYLCVYVRIGIHTHIYIHVCTISLSLSIYVYINNYVCIYSPRVSMYRTSEVSGLHSQKTVRMAFRIRNQVPRSFGLIWPPEHTLGYGVESLKGL